MQIFDIIERYPFLDDAAEKRGGQEMSPKKSWCIPLTTIKYPEYSMQSKKPSYHSWFRQSILFLAVLITVCLGFPVTLCRAQDSQAISRSYTEYRQRLESVGQYSGINQAGFQVVEDQVFPITMEGEGEVSFIPAFDRQYNRLVLFFARPDGSIFYRTDQLEANNQIKGELLQPASRVAAVSFQDMDSDGRTDIVLITACLNETGEGQGKPYKVGDVLFQKKGGFYRDYRLSDKMNRFGMNKSIRFITSFIRDGYSTEFLYTASTKKELLAHGMSIIPEQNFSCRFEKLGTLFVVPGTYRMAEYTVFMLYLVNDQGYIVWSFQPMGEYEHLYALKGISCEDIDGDGLKDIIIQADYSYEGSTGESIVESSYSIYYQRTGGFNEDTDIKKTLKLNEGDTLEDLTDRARAYWGWRAEP